MNSTILVGVASIFLAFLFRSQTDALPAVAQRMPTLLLWVVAGLAVLMIVEDVVKRRKAKQPVAGTPAEDDDEPLPPINWPVVCVFGIAIVAYVALIPVVGYMITTAVFIAGALVVARTMRLPKAVMVGVGTTVAVAAIFIWALSLPVPILPFLK